VQLQGFGKSIKPFVSSELVASLCRATAIYAAACHSELIGTKFHLSVEWEVFLEVRGAE
jgi:hypothetical protein